MYPPYNTSSRPIGMGYHMNEQTPSSEIDTDPIPQIYHPEGFCSWGDRDYAARTASMSSPLLAPVTHNVRYSFPHGPASLQVPAGTYNGMPHLNPYAHVDTSASPLSLGSFERSTAASEYHYSESYESEVAEHAHIFSHYGVYKPSPEAEPYIFPPNPPEVQEIPFASYLHVYPGEASHRPSSSYDSSSHPNVSSEAHMRAGMGEVTLMLGSAALGTTNNASRRPLDPEMEGVTARKQKTRKPFEPERRLEVRRMRQTGACFRCRWLKKPVGTPSSLITNFLATQVSALD